MTDLHTHILPQMDDGARDLTESLAMLALEDRQKVDTVVLTPHFYRDMETVEAFLQRRQQALERLLAAAPEEGPRLLPGAEVAWYPSILEEGALDKLCLADTNCILLELPSGSWNSRLLDQLYQFAGHSGLTPILAHVERFLPMQQRSQVEELLSMELPMQMDASALLKPLRRRKALALLKRGKWFLGSDCHNMDTRPPCMGEAAAYLRLPQAEQILSWQPEMMY